jgi:GNAT superfamily N-acetyltransferase
MQDRGEAQAIRIRPIEPGDRAALSDFYGALSPDTMLKRFHGVSHGIADGDARRFCGPDHEHREGLVAELRHAPGGTAVIIGHLCMEPAARLEAELAIAVADAWQHQGVGRELLAAGLEWAQRNGLRRVHASILTGNAAMLGLLRSAGIPIQLGAPTAGALDATIELGAPTAGRRWIGAGRTRVPRRPVARPGTLGSIRAARRGSHARTRRTEVHP